MKLQDYLHYYIGCTCIFYMADDDPEGYHTTLDYDTIKRWLADKDETDIKPLLRRLEDMTEAEAIAIATMAMFDKPPGYPVRDYTVKRESMGNYPPSTCKVAINNDWHDMEIAIGFNTGNIWFTKFEQRVFNQPAIFHTLLQQHFDLFGLVEAGLAVDIKTVTP